MLESLIISRQICNINFFLRIKICINSSKNFLQFHQLNLNHKLKILLT